MKKLLLSLLIISSTSLMAQVWTEQDTNFPVSGSYTGDISIVDANIAWAMVQRTDALNHQTFSKTTDGGLTWTAGSINVGNATGLAIGNISAVSATTAWVSVFYPSTPIATQGVYKTIDGGATWAKQTTAAFNAASFCNFVYFWDANNGVCMGDKKNGYFEIYTTTNGGTNWVRTPAINIPTTATDYGYTGKFSVTGNTIWFGTDGGELMRSTDKGLTWTKIVTPIPDFGSPTTTNGEFSFKDNNIGVIQQNNVPRAFYVTLDGGTTWSAATTPANIFWGSIAYVPGTNILVSGGSSTDNFGTSFSLDNGTTWSPIDVDSHTCLAFKDATTGWGGGFTVGGIGGAYKFNAALSTNDFANASKFKAYPNPANTTVTLAVADGEAYKLVVTDLTGKVVMEKSLSGFENTLDISALSSGAYFFTLNSDSKTETVKIIKN